MNGRKEKATLEPQGAAWILMRQMPEDLPEKISLSIDKRV